MLVSSSDVPRAVDRQSGLGGGADEPLSELGGGADERLSELGGGADIQTARLAQSQKQ